MNLWLLFFILIISYIYLSYYYRYPKKVSILQSSLNRFDLTLLQEKQPIVIEDAIKDMNDIKKAWFKWNYTRQWSEIVPEKWIKNNYKYLMIHPEEECEVFLYPPTQPWIQNAPDPDKTVIIIKLKPHQLIIVPYHWKWMIETKKQINFLGIHDAITLILP